jgi:hypothetical protein
MRRGGTLLVVVAVSAIALAASWDALRDGDEPAAQPEELRTVSTTNDGPTNFVPLDDPETLTGVLYYTEESCELRATQLPDLRPTEAPNWDECRFVLSPDGTRVGDQTTGWDPHTDPRRGRLFQVREDGTIQVSTNAGPEGEPFPGRAPAWRPDGTLTYFDGRAIRDWPEGNTIVPETRIRLAVSEHPNAPGSAELLDDVRVVEHHWLDPNRLVAVLDAQVRGGTSLNLVEVFEDGLPFATTAFFESIEDLWVSPFGTYFAVDTGAIRLYDRTANALALPELSGGRAVAWSPDERRMAIATEASVYVFRPGESDLVRRLELVANDLEWREAPRPDALAEVDEARGWLESTGASGRLVFTTADETGCSLQALLIPGLAWAQEPAGARSPCRFTLGAEDEILAEDEHPQPGGDRVAVCRNHAVDVLENGELFVGYPGACAPAWMPDGVLTFVRDGELFQADSGGERLLISRADLRERLGRPSALAEVVWASDQQIWAVVRSGESATIALLTEGQLAMSPSFTARTIEGLRVSTTGMVAARTDVGVVFFDSGGRRALTFPNGRAVAWAPDQLVAAVATPQSIILVAPISGEVVSLPLAVRDLEWVVP